MIEVKRISPFHEFREDMFETTILEPGFQKPNQTKANQTQNPSNTVM